MLLDLPDFTDFSEKMVAHFKSISLSPQDIQDRKDLIQFIRGKVKNRNHLEG